MKKGFTLVELLGVIILIGIVILIAVPIMNNSTDKSELSAFKTSVNNVVTELERYVVENRNLEKNVEMDIPYNKLELSTDSVYDGTFIIDSNGNVKVDKITDGKYCIVSYSLRGKLDVAKCDD